MILIDAVFIHTGGGKSLLDYLISEINKANIEVFYLLDVRYESQAPKYLKKDHISFVSGFIPRCNFYSKNRNKFSKVFCLGNIPPHIMMADTEVIMYLHSVSYIDSIIKDTLIHKILQYIKKKIFYLFINNAKLWIVQTQYMKTEFEKKTAISADNIIILPFFKIITNDSKIMYKEKNSFFYPASAETHKNHKKLIDSFCLFFDKFKTGTLYLTVKEEFKEVVSYIAEKETKYPIINLGYVNKKDIETQYLRSEFLVFPSLQESFGLPLIEAVEFNCKIIAADLPYVFEVCIPSYVFDPKNLLEITKAFENAVNIKKLPNSYTKVNNEIDRLINILNDK